MLVCLLHGIRLLRQIGSTKVRSTYPIRIRIAWYWTITSNIIYNIFL